MISSCNIDLINKIRYQSKLENIPSVSHLIGSFLEMLISILNAKTIVEIGCANGCSTCYLINGAIKTNGIVISFEKDSKRFDMAYNNLSYYIQNLKLKLIHGDILENLNIIQNLKIDFLFIDAMKRQYKQLLEMLLPYVNKGGVIVSDDIFFQGVINSEKMLLRHKNIVKGLREYINYLNELEAKNIVENYFFEIEDGISLTKKIV